jgi:alkylhydroperoxidase family enzyme
MDEVARYQESTGLSASQKAALRMHDSFLAHPAGFGRARRAEALEHFSPTQIVELAFKFVWWSTNRATVTLGDDAPRDENRVTWFHYDEQGTFIVHAAED